MSAQSPLADIRRRNRRRAGPRRRYRWTALLYIAPAFIVYVLFVVLPALHTAYFSLLNWDGINDATWAGFANYRAVAHNPLLRDAIMHALILIVFFSFIPILLGLLLTGLLGRHRRRGMTFFRIVFFLPQIVPLVAVGITWRWMYTQDGAVNQILRFFGLARITRAWLGDFHLALFAVGVIGTWTLAGLCMMLFLSGVQKVDTALYEAARLDGAGPLREFLSVTLPALRGEIRVALTVTTISALASFDIVYVSTNGAPGNKTTVPGLLVYRLAFSQDQVGLAAALAVVLTVLILVVVGLISLIVRSDS